MASTDGGVATSGYEPQPREGHALVEYKGCTYLVGGHDFDDRPIDPSLVVTFHPTTLKWQRHTTTGVGPEEVYFAACAVLQSCLYVFGGSVKGRASNALWRLGLESLQWSLVQQTNTPPPRYSAGLVADKEQRLVLYGGKGYSSETLSDLYMFSVNDGKWSSPAITGTPPPPPWVGFSFTLMGSRAVLIGSVGVGVGGGDVGVYDFDIYSKHWSEENIVGPKPRWRRNHAAVSLSTQTLLLSGGWKGGTMHMFGGYWILDLSARRWRKVELPGDGSVRRKRHAAAAVRSDNTVHVIEFGGRDQSDTILASTTVMQMTLYSEVEGGADRWKLVNYSTLPLLVAAAAAAKNKRIYEAALLNGYINTRNSVMVFNGAGGSGKTHVKEAISSRPPPSVRESTGLSEDPITFSVVDASDGEWKLLDEEQQARMLASAMAAMATLKYNNETHPQTSQLNNSASPSPTEDASASPMASSFGASSLPPSTATPTLDLVGPAPPTPPSPHTPPSLQPKRKEARHNKPHPVESDFLDRLGRARATLEPYNYDLVYLFDTGGQPAFHAILPLFFPMVMFLIFVLKLSEKLDHHPEVHYFVRGKPVGAPYKSPLSHLQIAQHSFSAVQSQMLAQKGSSECLPKMIIVGTHRDREWRCSETTVEKNRRLADILSPSFQDHLIYYSAEGNSLIFPLDAKHRKQQDCQVAAEIRQAITMATTVIERKKTPLSWHVLELALRELAGKLGRGFLTRVECITEATKLGISEQVFDAALDHFVQLNTILHYRKPLPNLVFIQAQPLMNKITELIQKTHVLRGQVPDKNTPGIDGKWLRFRDQGIVTCDILKSFPDGYLEGVFTAAELVRLMEHKLLISSLDHSSYFMPVLLPDLAPEEVAKHRTGPDSAIAPLTILFPCNLVPTGLFCSLVSFLLSAPTPPQLCLKPSPSDRALMECVASNCIKFSLPDTAGSVVLVNTHMHLELHLSAPLMEDPAPLCLALKAKVLTSILEAADALHFDQLEPQPGFLCETSTPHAKVRVTPERHWLGRLVLGDPRQVEVAPPTHPALLSKGGGWRCSLDNCVCGRFQKRHTVWLQPSGGQSPVAVEEEEAEAAGGGAAVTGGGGAAVGRASGSGHPSDAIFDKFPECKSAKSLGPGDLGQVLRVLHDAGLAAKWRAIGQTLTVSNDDLAGFDTKFSGDPSLCLLQVVALWLCGQKRLSDPPSWQRLVRAVADPQGGDTVHGGKKIAAMFRAEGELSKFVPTCTHAKGTPPTPLLDDFTGGSHTYDSVDEATEALSMELSAVAHRWVQVGVLLGVAFSWLEQRRSARQDDQQNLRDTLCHGLDTLGEAFTLQRLVEAVEHSAGGNNPALAETVKNKLTL